MTQTRPASPVPPVAKKIPHRFDLHGDVRVDDYFWLREKDNPEVIAHLHAENAYTMAVLEPTKDIQEKLFLEMKARIKEQDESVPAKKDDWYYFTRMEEGKQYAIHYRKRSSLSAPEELVLDENALAENQKYFRLGVFRVSPDHRWLAYSADLDGSEKYTIRFKNLQTGEHSPEAIPHASHSLEWAADNRTVFYTLLDENLRPDRLLRHSLGEDPSNDRLIYKEQDPQLFVYCSKSPSDDYIFLDISGSVTTEIHFLDARQPLGEFRVIEPRRRGVIYGAAQHQDRFFIVANDTHKNFRLVEAPISAPGASNWKELRAGSSEIYVRDVSAFRSHLVLHERQNGLPQIRVIDLKNFSDHLIEFPDPAYELSHEHNPEFDTETFRFGYTSLVAPETVIDYDLRTRAKTIRKVQEVPSGYDSSRYRSERIFATAPDGERVPITLVYRLDQNGDFHRDGSRPVYLSGYGSYGMSQRTVFSTARLSLLDRGFICAYAHIRGGSDLGRHWYEDGKFLKKKNTFTDFIACAEHLINEGYCKKGEMAIVGGSAGGMLMGAAVNMRPELFKAAVAHVPFVDVLNTMLDESLPLTTREFEEWGNPMDPVYYEYIKSYSPYDNVEPKFYPHMLVTSGLNDPRVTYWEPAKWVAKLRELKTDDFLLLQHIDMESGHFGASGRFEYLKKVALEYAFLLLVFDKT